MKTTLSERGRTAIPARIRKRFKLKAHQRLEWAEDGKVIYVLPVAKDPISAFRGSSPRGVLRALLAARREDAGRRSSRCTIEEEARDGEQDHGREAKAP